MLIVIATILIGIYTFFLLTRKIKKNRRENRVEKLRADFHMARLNLLLSLMCLNYVSFSQLPKKAKEIADSIVKSRMICKNTSIELEDSIYYPKFKNQYQDRKTESYFFTYKVTISNNLITDLNISIDKNFSITYINGMPDKNYIFSPCEIIEREKLWQIAKNKGLKTKFKKCFYVIEFEEEGILIRFFERKSRFNTDHYTLNALTGEYKGHVKANICF